MTTIREPRAPKRATELFKIDLDHRNLIKRVALLEAALKPFADCDPDLGEHWTFRADQIRAARKAYYGWGSKRARTTTQRQVRPRLGVEGGK